MKRWQQVALGITAVCGLAAAWWWQRPGIEQAVPAPPAVQSAQATGTLGGSLLSAGTTLDAELAGGERHVFSLRLDAGDYLHVVVDQRGIDVEVTVFDPGGRAVLAVDSPNGPEGPEPVAAVASVRGVHRLEIEGAQGAEPGGYQLRVAALGPAGEGDRAMAAAMQSFARAEQLRAQGDGVSLRAALSTYREALAHWRVLAAPRLRALALRRSGQVLYRLGEVRPAVRFYEQSRELYRAHGNGWEKVPLLNDLGSAYRLAGAVLQAMKCHQQALEIAGGLGNRSAVAAALNNLGLVQNSLGDLHQALEFYHRALVEWRQLGAIGKQATALHNVGQIYATLRRTEEAMDFLRRSLELRRQLEDPRALATTLTAVGWISYLEGDASGALTVYEEALGLERDVGDRIGEAVTLDLRGAAYLDLERTAAAGDSYLRALEIFREAGSALDQAHTLSHLGALRDAGGDAGAARGYHREALMLFRRIGDLNGEASALVASARAERRDDLPAARRQLERALELTESVRGRLQSRALRRDYAARRHDVYTEYVDLLMELEELEPRRGHGSLALEASERARARSLLESLAEAEAGMRAGAAPELLDREKAMRARIAVAEDRHRRLVREDASREQIEAVDRELRSLLVDYETLQSRMTGQTGRWLALAEARPWSVKEIQEDLLDEDTLLLWYSLGRERSFLWVVGRRSLTSHVLPAERDISALARQVAEVMPRSHERGLGLQARQAAGALSAMILGPAADQLGANRLVIAADGPLQYVSFSALPDPAAAGAAGAGPPLLTSHEVVHLPSASVLAALRRESETRPPARGLLAVIADPIFDREDPRLAARASPAPHSTPPAAPRELARDLERSARDLGVDGFKRLVHSAAEAAAILALVPEEQRFAALGHEASRDTVMSGELSGYRFIHFATRGVLNARHPTLSGIVLSLVDETGRPRDGLLRVQELFDLRLSADLVVLSACQTALGKEVRGEGMIGLTYGFFYAGASRVMVSLWRVSDRATAELMTRFYRGLLEDRRSPAQALRAAQLSMASEDGWQAPYYWAGFILQGDWR